VERAKPAPKPQAAKPKTRRPFALALIEKEIAAREAEVAELETKLAEDWTNVDVLAAHKRSRDALTALLQRWEQLFETAQTGE
jgi:predicted RNase H-like nuclease (RuvC/YqgF family)